MDQPPPTPPTGLPSASPPPSSPPLGSAAQVSPAGSPKWPWIVGGCGCLSTIGFILLVVVLKVGGWI